jgi:hypothetical protein
LLVAVGVGGAAAQALEPDFVDIRQSSWKDNRNLVLEPELLARLYAQGGIELQTGIDQSAYSGISEDRFRDLAWLAQSVPGAPELLFLWRYGIIDEPAFRQALQKTGVRPDFVDAIAKTFTLPLDAGAIATAVHRGIMDGTGLILQEPPTAPGNVKIVPPSTLDPVAQAQALGISHEQLRILVGNTGLPLSLFEMLQLLNRGIVTEDDVKRAIAESNLRNEYMDVAIPLKRRLLTPHEYGESQLRGVLTPNEAKDGAALHGMEGADYDTLFAILGRPLAVHQITTGEARGGTYGGDYTDVPAGAYRDAIRRSAIRPEYASLAFANRYTYSVPFWWRAFAQTNSFGTLDPLQLLLDLGNEPEFAKAIVAHYLGGTGITADPHVKKAQGTLWTEAHKAYVKTGISVAQVTPAFTALGIPADAQTAIVALWDVEKTLQSDVPPTV